MQCNFHKINLTLLVYLWAWSYVTCIRFVDAAGVAIASCVDVSGVFIICFRCHFSNVLFFVSLLSLFSLSPNSILSRTGREGKPRCLQFDSAHDHVSFFCAIPTHPISKTAGQFHQPYCYSLPPLQRPANAPSERGLQSRDAPCQTTFFGLSRPLRDFGDSPGSSSFTHSMANMVSI